MLLVFDDSTKIIEKIHNCEETIQLKWKKHSSFKTKITEIDFL